MRRFPKPSFFYSRVRLCCGVCRYSRTLSVPLRRQLCSSTLNNYGSCHFCHGRGVALSCFRSHGSVMDWGCFRYSMRSITGLILLQIGVSGDVEALLLRPPGFDEPVYFLKAAAASVLGAVGLVLGSGVFFGHRRALPTPSDIRWSLSGHSASILFAVGTASVLLSFVLHIVTYVYCGGFGMLLTLDSQRTGGCIESPISRRYPYRAIHVGRVCMHDMRCSCSHAAASACMSCWIQHRHSPFPPDPRERRHIFYCIIMVVGAAASFRAKQFRLRFKFMLAMYCLCAVFFHFAVSRNDPRYDCWRNHD